MGDKYIESTIFDMVATFKETSALTPIFFVLFSDIDHVTKLAFNIQMD